MCFFFQAEDGIRDLVRSRGLGDVYKRQVYPCGAVIRKNQLFVYYGGADSHVCVATANLDQFLSLIHI